MRPASTAGLRLRTHRRRVHGLQEEAVLIQPRETAQDVAEAVREAALRHRAAVGRAASGRTRSRARVAGPSTRAGTRARRLRLCCASHGLRAQSSPQHSASRCQKRGSAHVRRQLRRTQSRSTADLTVDPHSVLVSFVRLQHSARLCEACAPYYQRHDCAPRELDSAGLPQHRQDVLVQHAHGDIRVRDATRRRGVGACRSARAAVAAPARCRRCRRRASRWRAGRGADCVSTQQRSDGRPRARP